MTCAKPFTKPLSRRAVLASATALSLAPMALTGPSAWATSEGPLASDPFDTLRDRWRTMMTGGNLDAGDAAYQERIADIDAAAEARWRTFDAGADRTALWPDLAPVTAASSAPTARARFCCAATAGGCGSPCPTPRAPRTR